MQTPGVDWFVKRAIQGTKVNALSPNNCNNRVTKRKSGGANRVRDE